MRYFNKILLQFNYIFVSISQNFSGQNSADISPEANTPDSQKSDDKSKSLGNIQTYREYKEALRQQRTQDTSAVYRTKDASTPDGSESISSGNKSQNSTPSPSIYSSPSNPNSPLSPYHLNKIVGNGSEVDASKKPIQKVTPSRSGAVTYQAPTNNGVNGNHSNSSENGSNGSTDGGYTKPNSPWKATTGILQHNNVPNLNNNNNVKGANGHKPLTATVGYVNNAKTGQKTNK